jgi:hypothetical protein
MASQETDDIVRRAELVYQQRLKAVLEKTHMNYFVAIEPDSGEYYLGQTLSEAASAVRKAHPGSRSFLMRVGHSAALHMGANGISTTGWKR